MPSFAMCSGQPEMSLLRDRHVTFFKRLLGVNPSEVAFYDTQRYVFVGILV